MVIITLSCQLQSAICQIEQRFWNRSISDLFLDTYTDMNARVDSTTMWSYAGVRVLSCDRALVKDRNPREVPGTFLVRGTILTSVRST